MGRNQVRARKRVVAKVLLATLTFAIVLEVVLQVAAITTSMVVVRRSEEVADDPHVLCVGDSFTYGQGATSSDKAYPKVLESLLAEKGHDVKVINGGWPGRTSRDLVRYYASQLTVNTKVLCILVGTNDAWQHPEPVSATELAELLDRPESVGEGFTWQFRTAKLLSVMLGFESGQWLQTGTGQSESAPGQADQSIQSNGKSSPGKPRRNPPGKGGLANRSTLAVEGRTLAQRVAALKLLVESGLVHREPVVLPNGLKNGVRIGEFWQLLNKPDLEGAREWVLAALEQSPDSPTLLAALAAAQARAGLSRDETLQRLQAVHDKAPTPLTLECLMMAAVHAEQGERAIELAKARIAQEPNARMAWGALADVSFNLGKWEEFKRAAPHAISLTALNHRHQATRVIRNYSRALRSDDPAQAARLAVAAFLLDPAHPGARLLLRKIHEAVPRDLLDEVLARVEVDDEVVAKYRGLLDEEYDGKVADGWKIGLAENLKTLNKLARANGTEVVMLTYPFPQKSVTEAQFEIAAEISAPVAHVQREIQGRLKGKKRTDFFVPDGHCNDNGYALMAEVVAPHVLKALGKGSGR